MITKACSGFVNLINVHNMTWLKCCLKGYLSLEIPMVVLIELFRKFINKSTGLFVQLAQCKQISII